MTTSSSYVMTNMEPRSDQRPGRGSFIVSARKEEYEGHGFAPVFLYVQARNYLEMARNNLETAKRIENRFGNKALLS